MLCDDPLHDEFASWGLGFAPYGGSDFGELQAIVGQVTAGDDASFHDAFRAFAERLIAEGDAAVAKGRRATAADCFLRAAGYLGIAYHVLYGAPVDPRLTDTFHLQMDTFAKSLQQADVPAEPMDVPHEGTHIPAYLVRAPGHERAVRPTIIVGGGWDSTMVENHLGIGVAALRRGYHVVLFDGPGQGRLLVDEGLPLRHDWERAVTPVVDATLALDGVDPDRVVYEPWSLGGYFAPRVAAYEHRLAAIVADPGQIDVGGKFSGMLAMFGLGPEALADLPHLDPADVAKVMHVLDGDRGLTWKIVKRGFWTNGASDFPSWLAEMMQWKLTPDEVAAIRCPTLVTAAEHDMASSNARELYDAITAPKAFMEFTDADGAGTHCEMMNRSFANRRILDWLDETLGVAD